MKKILLIIFIVSAYLNALQITPQNTKNANTALITLEKKGISNPKLTFDKHNIDFYPHPLKKETYYALIPVSYYKEKKKYRVIISYIKNHKKVFEGTDLNIIDGEYKSEVINVSQEKVTPSKTGKTRIDKEYKKAIDTYNKITKKLYTQGKFIQPMNSPVTSAFGKKRVYNGTLKSYHGGTDFKAKVGTEIKAVNSGVVVIAQNRFYAGNSIVIDHGRGIYSCYFHLSKMNYKEGERVKKGDIIALSGDTGRVTGPHLHFAFRVNGIQVDPLQIMTLLNKNNIY